MSEDSATRRQVVQWGGLAGAVGLAGCGTLTGGTDDSDTDDSDEETEDDSSPLFADDFESGELESWTQERFRDHRDYDQFHVTEDPSRGEYSLAHATGSRYLTPVTGLTVEPPVQVDLWLQLEFGSGIRVSFGRPDADHPRYVVALQYNANGNIVRIDEVTGDGRDVQKGTFPDFPIDEWTKFTVTWAADGPSRRRTANRRSRGRSTGISAHDSSVSWATRTVTEPPTSTTFESHVRSDTSEYQCAK